MSTAAPTTIAPTTLAPTTIVTTAAPTTLGATTVGPTTDSGVVIIVLATDTYIEPDPFEIEITLLGEPLSKFIEVDPLEVEISLEGSVVEGIVHTGLLEIEITIPTVFVVLEPRRCGFVKWSKIGYLDFTIDESNIAGERPMDWTGCVYVVKKLGSKVVVYGAGGVSILTPAGVNFGLETIHRLGLKGRYAVAGTDFEHYFIDLLGQLWKFTDTLKRLDYSEFLSQMTNPIMSMDIENNLIYICDGSYGYVYGIASESLGEGPPNVTGVGTLAGEMYVVAPGTITVPTFEICTDIHDMGTRKNKTIHSLELGTDLQEHLLASADFRTSNRREFSRIGWHLVNPSGYAYPKCFGVEFRFRVKSYKYEYFELDYLRVNGVVHNFTAIDAYAT